MSEDERNLDLLAIFHYILGGLTAFFSCFFLIHVAMGIAVLAGAFDGTNGPPRIFGLLFIVFPSILMILGWILAACMVATGRNLKRRMSRTFCLVVAGLECTLMPLGTILGVFTIVVLTKDSVKKLFAAEHSADVWPGA